MSSTRAESGLDAAVSGRRFLPAERGLRGALTVPGDKSVSHRALLLGAVSEGPVTVTGFLRSADTLATLDAVRALGVDVDDRGDSLTVYGRGWGGLREPEDIVDVRNAGTLMRLLPGLVASLDMLCVLTGDASIRRRPMARVLQPLAAMGACVAGRDGDSLPPVAIRGGRLKGMTHTLSVASAQVKSAVILAGLRAKDETVVIEPAPSRDHTERMIRHAGASVAWERGADGRNTVRLSPTESLHLGPVTVPGDISSAAFFVVGALLVPESEISISEVGLNPTRTGLLDVLKRMGARLDVTDGGDVGGEPLGSIVARGSALTATDVGTDEVPGLIDELPLFLLAAAKAEGTSHLRGAADLRVKESDRLKAMAALLNALGVQVVEHPDGMDVVGDPRGWKGGRVASLGDHRLAMVGAVAGAASTDGVTVDDVACAGVSYPGFVEALEGLGCSSAPADVGAADREVQS